MVREDVILNIALGRTFCCIIKQAEGKWQVGSALRLDGNNLKWDSSLPFIQTKRKCFVSYYHYDDSDYKEEFLELMDDLTVSKSVEDGDIDSDLSDEYIKQLIQKEYLYDTTVLIVLIGPKTKCRKHVDWEISGALNYKVGDSYAGLLGLILPEHHDYGTEKPTYSKIPERLADNFKSGYAVIKDYTIDRNKLQEYIELAYKNRKSKADKRVNKRLQMQEDTCE
jgi:hypothetical protein